MFKQMDKEQGLHRLEKYLKIKSAMKSTGKSFKGLETGKSFKSLEKAMNSSIFC